MQDLKGTIALVGGASRGAGRGIAVVLGEAGATVYCAARTARGGPPPSDGAPGTVEDTAEEVTRRGGKGIAVRADLSRETEVEALLQRVEQEHGRLDLVANAAWATDFVAFWDKPYWEMPSSLWQGTLDTMSAYWHVSVHATRLMRRHGGGLLIYVTDNMWGDPSDYRGHITHDLGHEFLNRLVAGLSRDSAQTQVAVMGLNPGFMRTERVRMSMTSEELKKQFRYDLSESPEYIGRAVVALAADPKAREKTGKLLRVADLAKEYGFTDIDGRFIPVFDPSLPMQPFPD